MLSKTKAALSCAERGFCHSLTRLGYDWSIRIRKKIDKIRLMEPNVMRLSCGLLAAWFACGGLCSAALDVADSLLVDLDAADFTSGAEKWQQHKPMTGITGDFLAKGSPTRQTVGGATSVVFDGDGDYFIGPITTAALHAPGARHSVEVWVFQGNVRDQESVVSWGKRLGPDLSFAGFRYGADPDFGAIARWGSSESGFVIVPPPGRWHHIVYTYDGDLQSIYVDGKLDCAKAVGMLDAHDMLPIHLGVEISGDLKLEGQFTHFSGALAKLRIHSGALTAVEVKHNYDAERALFPGLVAKPLQQPPMHRFSFNAAAGSAPNGTTVLDSIGGLSAVIRGANAKFTGSAIQLPGGSPATEAYVDLPNGLISSRESLSIEFWETEIAAQNWCRILSIGTNKVGEITGPGGNFTGSETLTLFGNVGATQVNRFARSFGTYPNGGPDRNPAEYPDSDYGVEFHQVINYDKGLKEWHWYRNGVLMEVIPDSEGPTTINDVNVWLGRSEFSIDSNFRGLYHEFRVYNHTLSEGEIYGNFMAGPDKLDLGGAVTALNWMPVEPGIHSFINNGGSDHWNTGPGGGHPDGPGGIATFASALVGDQDIELDAPVTLGTINLGTRSQGGAFRLRGKNSGALTMDSGNGVPASITQLPGSPVNAIDLPIALRSDTEVTNQSSSALILGGAIRGAGAFIKSGSGSVVLTGDGGAHTGPVKILAGALLLGNSSDTGMLAASDFTITDPGHLILNRSDDIRLGGAFTGSGRIIHQGHGTVTLSKTGSFTNRGMLDMMAGSGTFINEGTINGPRAMRTDSEMILRGHSTTRLLNWLSVGSGNGGILRLEDSAKVEIHGDGHLNIGDVGTGQSTMVMKGGSASFREFFIGKNVGTSGLLLQSGGDLKKDGMLDSRIGGAVPGTHDVWGAWLMTGGTFNDDWNLQVGTHGIGVLEIDGGSVNVAGFLGIGRFEDDAKYPSRGLVDVKSGKLSTTSRDNLLLVGEEGIGVLNIRGKGSVTCVNRMIIGGGTISKPGEGTVNLLGGGTLTASGIGQFNQSEAVGQLNLDGGMLRAGAASEAFLDGLDFIYVRKGGAQIDSNGFDLRINLPLLAPKGNGLATIPVKDHGAAYAGPPLIEVSGGGGIGATAVADLADGSIKTITLTNAGENYISPPTVSILGGGSGSGLVLGTPTLVPNVSGGLIKTGSGILTLGGTSTYTGATSVKQGGLRVEGQLAGSVEVAAGATFGGGGSVMGSVEMAPGSLFTSDSNKTMTVRGDMAMHGTLVLEATEAGGGRLDVSGKLDISGAKLATKSTAGKVRSPVHVIASYSSLLGRFAEAESLPSGYTLDYHYNGQNQIALVATAADPDGE